MEQRAPKEREIADVKKNISLKTSEVVHQVDEYHGNRSSDEQHQARKLLRMMRQMRGRKRRRKGIRIEKKFTEPKISQNRGL